MSVTRRRRSVVVLAMLAACALAPSCWTYKGDVARACDAEHLSGEKADGPAILEWLKRGMSTPEGVVLANELSTKGPADRALQLRGEARKADIVACPLADAFDALAKTEAFRQDVSNLCDARAVLPGGGSAVLDISTLPDDAERLREVREWSLAQLKTTEAQDIVPRMGQVAPKDRGQALRAEATRAGIALPCALADALDRPLPAVARPGPPPALPTLTITGYDGARATRKYTGFALDAVRLGASAINTCYAKGLGRDPRLSGRLSVHVSLDGTGKMTSATAEGSFPDKKVVKCIVADGFSSMSFPKPDKGSVRFTVGLALAPAASLGAPAITVLPLTGRPH